MPHGVNTVQAAREKLARSRGFTPFNPDPGGFNLFEGKKNAAKAKALS